MKAAQEAILGRQFPGFSARCYCFHERLLLNDNTGNGHAQAMNKDIIAATTVHANVKATLEVSDSRILYITMDMAWRYMSPG